MDLHFGHIYSSVLALSVRFEAPLVGSIGPEHTQLGTNAEVQVVDHGAFEAHRPAPGAAPPAMLWACSHARVPGRPP